MNKRTYKNKSSGEWNKYYTEGEHWEEIRAYSRQMEFFVPLLKEGDKILDLGCGSGRDSIYLTKLGYEVWGTDNSKEAIDKAKQKFSSNKLHFSVADAKIINFENDFFNVVYSGWVLNVVNDLKKPAKEIYRVLKKKGFVYLALLLNIFYVSGEKEHYYSEEEILEAYKDFKIIKKERIKTEDSHAKDPHTHDALILILQKE